MPQNYDVFLSYNREDRSAVQVVADRLVNEGIEPWFDKWHLVPGEVWQEAIEDALRRCSTCAVFVGRNGLGPWQNEEIELP